MTGPPAGTHRTNALELANFDWPYWLQVSEDKDSPWKLVRQRAHCELHLSKLPPEEVAAIGKGAAWLPQTVTVTFTDGDIRILNPYDTVEWGDV